MSFSYNPKDASSCWPEGDYDAIVASVERAKTAKGEDMWKVGVKIFNAEGRERIVRDFIVIPLQDGSTKGSLYKLKQIAQAIGRGSDFTAGKFVAEDAVDNRFTVKVGIQPAKGNYDESNCINKYSAASGTAPARQPAMAGSPISDKAQFTNDDIKF